MKSLLIEILFLFVCVCVNASVGFGQLNNDEYSVVADRSKNEAVITRKSREINWTSHILPFDAFHIFPTGDGKNVVVLMKPSQSEVSLYQNERMVVWNIETGQRDAISQKSLIGFFPNPNSEYAEFLNYFKYDNNADNMKAGNPKLFYDFENHRITGIWEVSQIKGEYILRDELNKQTIRFTPNLKDDKKVSVSSRDAVAFDEKNLIAWYPQEILKSGGKFLFRIVKVDYRSKTATIIYQNEFPTFSFDYESHYEMGNNYLLHRFENVGVKVFSLTDNSRPIYEIPDAAWKSLETQFGGFQCYNDGELYFAKYDSGYYVLTVVSASNPSSFKTYKYRSSKFDNRDETGSDFLISGRNRGEIVRTVKFSGVTHLMLSKLSPDDISNTKVADFDSSGVYDKRLAEVRKQKAEQKAEEDRQAQIAEEKRRQQKIEDERREREEIAALKQNNLKRYGLLQKAIEQNDTESIKLLVAGLREIYFDNPAENFDGNFNGAVLYLRVFSPKLDVGLLENKLSMRISRPADLVLVPANRNNSDGKEAISKDKQSFDVPMSATYSIFFSGKKISPLLTESATFRNGWSKMVNGINLACNCRAQPSDFQKGFDFSDELTDLASVEVESISWQGRITIRIITKRGSNWSFSGITTSYQNSSSNASSSSNSSNSSAQSSKVTTPKIETGNFGRAIITNKGSIYDQLNEIEGCLDWSWATPEQKRASGKIGWVSFTPQNGMEGEIVAKTENCVYHNKIVILKIGNYYVPIQENAVKRL